jgi:hypothetical protein
VRAAGELAGDQRVGIEDERVDVMVVHVETRNEAPRCAECGRRAWVKDRPTVELVDLPCFGRPARLVWHEHRWCCGDVGCPVGSWTGEDPAIAPARGVMTDRAGRWSCVQVGRLGRTVSEVARELGCDWHTVMDAVVPYETPLVEDPGSRRCGERPPVG